MAKITSVHGLAVEVSDSTIRTYTAKLTEAQVKCAVFDWMRLQGLDLPSQQIYDYSIHSGINGCMEMIYRKDM